MKGSSLSARDPLAARVLPGRYYYGWYVTAGVALVMMCGIGIGYYGLAVFLRPLQEAHGWSNVAVSGATALYFVVSGIAAAVVGPYIDRRGPLPFLVAGLVLTALMTTLVGFVEQLWQLYVVYALLATAFGMAGGVSTNAIMTRWFIRRRARAMSVSATGVSSAGVILPPLGAWLIGAGGLELATPILGAVVLVVGLPVTLFVLVWDPRQMRLPPDGTIPATADRQPDDALSDAVQLREWTVAQALRTVSFWALTLAFVLVLLAQTGFLIHQIAFLEERIGSRTAASLALSTAAIGSIVARLVVGVFADAVSKRHLTAALFVTQAIAVLLLVYIDNPVTTYVFTLTFGFTLGNIYMMQSLLVGEIFGLVSFGAVFGLVSFAARRAAVRGRCSLVCSSNSSGGYEAPLTVTACITFVAALVVLFARPLPPPEGPAYGASPASTLRCGGTPHAPLLDRVTVLQTGVTTTVWRLGHRRQAPARDRGIPREGPSSQPQER